MQDATQGEARLSPLRGVIPMHGSESTGAIVLMIVFEIKSRRCDVS